MPYYQLAGAAGIEPALTVLETVALPLNYAPVCCNILTNLPNYYNN